MALPSVPLQSILTFFTCVAADTACLAQTHASALEPCMVTISVEKQEDPCFLPDAQETRGIRSYLAVFVFGFSSVSRCTSLLKLLFRPSAV